MDVFTLLKWLAVVVKVTEVRGQERAGSGTLVCSLKHENPHECFSNGFPGTGFLSQDGRNIYLFIF